jgi:hypothetical protein
MSTQGPSLIDFNDQDELPTTNPFGSSNEPSKQQPTPTTAIDNEQKVKSVGQPRIVKAVRSTAKLIMALAVLVVALWLGAGSAKYTYGKYFLYQQKHYDSHGNVILNTVDVSAFTGSARLLQKEFENFSIFEIKNTDIDRGYTNVVLQQTIYNLTFLQLKEICDQTKETLWKDWNCLYLWEIGISVTAVCFENHQTKSVEVAVNPERFAESESKIIYKVQLSNGNSKEMLLPENLHIKYYNGTQWKILTEQSSTARCIISYNKIY